jgi:hypothetical protein
MRVATNADTQPDIWPGCGYRELTVDPERQLAITDAFLRGFYSTRELAPIDESCPAERALFAELLESPRLEVTDARIASLADPDARENYRLALVFRDLLLQEGTLEAAYFKMITGRSTVPAVFLPRLVQPILRHLLDGESDPLRWRASELFFRPQAVQADGEQVLLADLMTLRQHGGPLALRRLQALIREAQGVEESESAPELDAIESLELSDYRARANRFDTVLDITAGTAGSLALADVMARFIEHFHGVRVTIRPVNAFSGPWRWHIGLDAEASELLDDLYRDGELDPGEQWRLIALYELGFERPEDAAEPLRNHSVYLAAAMTEDEKLLFKPQNLLANLPLAAVQ